MLRTAVASSTLLVMALVPIAARAQKLPADDAAVMDVILRADGILIGRVVDPGEARAPDRLAGLPVKLIAGRQTAATAITGPGGWFGFRGLVPGMYRLDVGEPNLIGWRLARVWSQDTAPPRAASEALLSLGAPLVRGQYSAPLPIMNLRQAATITAIAAGAIAAPVIYNNARSDNRIPTSP